MIHCYTEWLHTRVDEVAQQPQRSEADVRDWMSRLRSLKQYANHMPAIVSAAEGYLRRTPAEFADQPHELRCGNDIVNLRTGVVRPATPADLGLRRTRVAYTPTATCPRFLRFLEEIFQGTPPPSATCNGRWATRSPAAWRSTSITSGMAPPAATAKGHWRTRSPTAWATMPQDGGADADRPAARTQRREQRHRAPGWRALRLLRGTRCRGPVG